MLRLWALWRAGGRLLDRRESLLARAAEGASPCVEPLEGRTLLSAVTIDPSFAAAGSATFSIQQLGDGANAVKVLPDGKLLVAGTADVIEDSGDALRGVIIRLYPNGALDTTFGVGGVAIDHAIDQISDIAVRPDGKIVAVGSSFLVKQGTEAAVAQFNADGSIDTMFGSAGLARTRFGMGSSSFACVAIGADGKIAAVGTTNNQASSAHDFGDFAVARYNANGTLDTTFSGTGTMVANFSTSTLGSADNADAVVIQPDGKLVVGGFASNNPDASHIVQDFALIRYNGDGSPDTTFGVGGKVITDLNDTVTSGTFVVDHAQITDLMVQSDGKILAAGLGQFQNLALARYNTNGSLDLTFAGKGTLLTPPADNSISYRLRADQNGTFEVAGGFETLYVGRFDGAGNVLSSATTDAIPNVDAQDFAFTADGKVIVAGQWTAPLTSATDPNADPLQDLYIGQFTATDDLIPPPVIAPSGSGAGTGNGAGSGSGSRSGSGTGTGTGSGTGSTPAPTPLPPLKFSGKHAVKAETIYKFKTVYTSTTAIDPNSLPGVTLSQTGTSFDQSAVALTKKISRKGRRVTITWHLVLGTAPAGIYTLSTGGQTLTLLTIKPVPVRHRSR